MDNTNNQPNSRQVIEDSSSLQVPVPHAIIPAQAKSTKPIKTVLVFLAVVFILGGFGVWKYYKPAPKQQPAVETTAAPVSVDANQTKALPDPGFDGIEKIAIPKSQRPPLFPQDTPLSSDPTAILENYSQNSLNAQGSTQVYTSNNSVDENISLYKTYFEKRGTQAHISEASGPGDGGKTIVDTESDGAITVAVTKVSDASSKVSVSIFVKTFSDFNTGNAAQAATSTN